MLLQYFELHDALEFPVSLETLKTVLQENKTQKFSCEWSSELKFRIYSHLSMVVEDGDRSDIDIFGELQALPNGRSKILLRTELRPELYLVSGASGLIIFIFLLMRLPTPFLIKILVLLLPLWFWVFYKLQELILLGKFRLYISDIREELMERSLELELNELEEVAQEEVVEEIEFL